MRVPIGATTTAPRICTARNTTTGERMTLGRFRRSSRTLMRRRRRPSRTTRTHEQRCVSWQRREDSTQWWR
eukprot:867295-Pyramimonas_sp.AAC.1